MNVPVGVFSRRSVVSHGYKHTIMLLPFLAIARMIFALPPQGLKALVHLTITSTSRLPVYLRS